MNEVGGRLIAKLVLDTSRFEQSMDKVGQKFAKGMAQGKLMTNVILNMQQVLSDTERAVESMGGTATKAMTASTVAAVSFRARLSSTVPVLTTVQTALSKVYDASMMLAAPLATIGALSARAFSNFDQNVARVATNLRLNDRQRGQLTNRVFDISSQSVTPPDELVRAYGQLDRAGLGSARSLAILNNVNRFAVANNMEAADSARQLISVQRELGMASQDATRDQTNLNRIMDVVTKTTMIANVKAEELLDALGNRSAIGMRQLGMSLEEGAAVMAVFAEQGIRGTAAGQRFEMMLRELQIAATRHSAEWQRMGFSLYDAQGKFLPMSAIIRQLESSFRGASDEQRRYILAGLGFSDRTIQVVRSLIGFSRELGVYESQLKNANGVTQQAYDVYMKSFAAQMTVLWNNIKIVGIEIGQVLAPWILKLNEGIRVAIDWWRQLNPSIKEVIVGLTLAFAIGGPLVWLFSTISTSIMGFIATAGGLAFIAGLLGAIGFAILYISQAIADPAGGFVGAWNSSIESVKNFFGAIPGFLANFGENMGILWTWLRENWWKVLADIGNVIIAFVVNSTQMFGWLVVFVVRIIGEMAAEVLRVFGRILVGLAGIVGDIMKNIANLMLYGGQVIVNVLKWLFVDVGGELLATIGRALMSVGRMIGNVFTNVAFTMLAFGQMIVVAFSWLMDEIGRVLSWIGQTMIAWGVNIGMGFIRTVQTWWEVFSDFFKALPALAQIAGRAIQQALQGNIVGGIAGAVADAGNVFGRQMRILGEKLVQNQAPFMDLPQGPDMGRALHRLDNRIDAVPSPNFRNLMDGTDFSSNFAATLERLHLPERPNLSITPRVVETDFQGAFDRSLGTLAHMPGFMDGFEALADAWPEFNLALKDTAEQAAGMDDNFRRMVPNIPGLDDGTGLNAISHDPKKKKGSQGKSEFQEMSFSRFMLGNPSAQFDINRKRHVSDTITHDKLDRLIDVSSRDRAAVLG